MNIYIYIYIYICIHTHTYSSVLLPIMMMIDDSDNDAITPRLAAGGLPPGRRLRDGDVRHHAAWMSRGARRAMYPVAIGSFFF